MYLKIGQINSINELFSSYDTIAIICGFRQKRKNV